MLNNIIFKFNKKETIKLKKLISFVLKSLVKYI